VPIPLNAKVIQREILAEVKSRQRLLNSQGRATKIGIMLSGDGLSSQRCGGWNYGRCRPYPRKNAGRGGAGKDRPTECRPEYKRHLGVASHVRIHA
jgi:hypothetical protein